MNARKWALVRASRVADRTLQRIADAGVALVFWAADRADVKVTEFANLTDDEAA